MARPSDYSEDTLLQTREYLDTYETRIPTVAGLSLHLNVTRPTVYDWASQDEKPEFSYMVSQLQALQEHKLINGGLGNDYNSSIVKLLLTKHGYADKQETDLNANVGLTDMSEDELNAKIRILLKDA